MAAWIEAGLQPCVFLHTPDNLRAPHLALRFHQQLGERLPGLPALAAGLGVVAVLALALARLLAVLQVFLRDIAALTSQLLVMPLQILNAWQSMS